MNDPDDERDALIADGWTNDDIMHRRHVGSDETLLDRLCNERHALANKATVARLIADELFDQVKKLDERIKGLRG